MRASGLFSRIGAYAACKIAPELSGARVKDFVPLLDYNAEGRVHVRSAGSEPADRINPNVVAAMSELGVDISKEFPKPMTDEVIKAADAVITMGCGPQPGARTPLARRSDQRCAAGGAMP